MENIEYRSSMKHYFDIPRVLIAKTEYNPVVYQVVRTTLSYDTPNFISKLP
jgi:hypothetical protein